MTISNYYKIMRVDQFFRETIAKGKTNKQAAEILDVSPSTINQYKISSGYHIKKKASYYNTKKETGFDA